MGKDKKRLDKKISEGISKVSKKGIVAEFKEFISQGSVLNLAVGVIIGGAFQAIVSSLVADILMPFISLFTDGLDFSSWFIPLSMEKFASIDEAINAGVAVLTYGNFVSALINFLIMALVIFLIVKFFNKIMAANKVEEEEEEEPRRCEFCLMEVDDEARRCPHCTSMLDTVEEEQAEDADKAETQE